MLVGQECATPQGDFLVFGDLDPLPPQLEGAELLWRVQAQGGAAVAAHPFRPGRGVDNRLGTLGLVRLAEGINGRNRSEDNRQARLWGRELGLGLVGGSDAHTLAELGGVATYFPQEIRGHADLVAALNAGDGQPRRLRAATPPPAHMAAPEMASAIAFL